MAINQIFQALTYHERYKPKNNRFIYKQYYVSLDLSHLDNTCPFFSVDRFNLFSFYQKDYGPMDGSSLYTWAMALADQHFHEQTKEIKRILLVTQPRILGWAFNPASFWIYLNQRDEIVSVLVEVHNTYNENHSYLSLPGESGILTEEDITESPKVFHVSPFFDIKGLYQFRFKRTEKALGVWINYGDAAEIFLSTSLTGKLYPLELKRLLKLFIKIPAANIKTLALIHWQALKLAFKKANYREKPQPPQESITLCFLKSRT